MLEVEVQDVELVRLRAHALEHQGKRRERILDRGIEPQRPRRAGDEPRGGLRVAAREERHIVPQPHQLLAEVGLHALGAAVKLRRHGFGERCDLGNPH